MKCLFFTKNGNKSKQNTFYFEKGPDKVYPRSYLSPSGMENQGYVVLWVENYLSVSDF